jgi:RNA polymerase primary sigma factor
MLAAPTTSLDSADNEFEFWEDTAYPPEVEAAIREISDRETRQAVDDLLGDWEREGNISQARVDQLAVTRKLRADQLAQVMSVTRLLGTRQDEEPTEAELATIEHIPSEKAESEPTNVATFDSKARLLRDDEITEVYRAIRLGKNVMASDDIRFTAERADIIKRAEAARERMILGNTGLVYTIAREFAFLPLLPFEDLVQEGMIGLMKAVERFDLSKGCRFSTYARWWIRQGIQRALANKGTTIRIPVHRVNDLYRFRRAKEAFTVENDGEEPTLSAIATALNWSIEKATAVEALSSTSYMSLDTPLREESDMSVGDTIECDCLSPSDHCEAKERHKWVTEAIDDLTERHRNILRRRFGLGNYGTIETLEEIGGDYRVTRERIRQLQNEGLKTLRPRAKRWIERGLVD